MRCYQAMVTMDRSTANINSLTETENERRDSVRPKIDNKTRLILTKRRC